MPDPSGVHHPSPVIRAGQSSTPADENPDYPTIDDARYPFAPRLDPLKAILAKLEPPKPESESLPPLKPGGAPSV